MSKTIKVGNGKYIMDELIGKGSFGLVYKGFTLNNQLVAIKCENKTEHKLLEQEIEMYKLLKTDNYKVHIPHIYWYGVKNKYNILVMEDLGKALETLFNERNRRFSLKTTIMIGIQICDLLEHLHRCKIIHRDLKPENFLIGHENKNYIYMIDFGLAKRYKNDKNMHMGQKTGKNLIGTLRYASVNSHIGNDLSRRDDLESLFYIMVYFYKGSLPWQGVSGKTMDEKNVNISNIKSTIKPEELCKNMPNEFLYFFKYVKALAFTEKPNYKYLKSLLLTVLKLNNLEFDYIYDWS